MKLELTRLELKKQSRENAINFMLNGKDIIIRLIAGYITKDITKMSEYFPKEKSLRGSVKIELDWSNYASKTDLKNATGVYTSDFAKDRFSWFKIWCR